MKKNINFLLKNVKMLEKSILMILKFFIENSNNMDDIYKNIK